MMKPILAAFFALLPMLGLTGCVVFRDDGGYHSYRNDRGDLIIDNEVRYVGWCDAHPHNARCSPAATIASGR
jgi:hypothetical protein